MFWPHGCQAIRRHCVDVTISTRILMNIVAAVSSIRMWSLLCLWMSCLQRCQAIQRHSADHSTEYCFIRVPVATCTLINIVAPVWCIWMWYLLCLWMSCLQSCQAFHRQSADHLTEYCFIRVPVAKCTLINTVAPVWCIWMWSLLCLWMSCLQNRQAFHRHSAAHSTEYCFIKVRVATCTLINTVAPVWYSWMWSLLCLWMSCLQSCQAFRKHSADHSTIYCFIRVPVATCTLINTVAPVWCIWMGYLLCPWMSCLQSCQTFDRHSADHSSEYCFIRVPVATCTLINTVAPVWYIWMGYLLCLWMSCLQSCQAFHRHSADHST